jgi:hypothetical protein
VAHDANETHGGPLTKDTMDEYTVVKIGIAWRVVAPESYRADDPTGSLFVAQYANEQVAEDVKASLNRELRERRKGESFDGT